MQDRCWRRKSSRFIYLPVNSSFKKLARMTSAPSRCVSYNLSSLESKGCPWLNCLARDSVGLEHCNIESARTYPPCCPPKFCFSSLSIDLIPAEKGIEATAVDAFQGQLFGLTLSPQMSFYLKPCQANPLVIHFFSCRNLILHQSMPLHLSPLR